MRCRVRKYFWAPLVAASRIFTSSSPRQAVTRVKLRREISSNYCWHFKLNFSKFRKELLQMASFYPILFSFSFSLFIKCANKVTFWLEFGCNSFQDRKYPFTTAGRKTDTIFELFRVFLHACHTVNNHLIAFKFSEWFVQCPCIPFWGKIVLIYLYCSSFYTCSSTLVKIFEKSPKRHTVKTNFFLF